MVYTIDRFIAGKRLQRSRIDAGRLYRGTGSAFSPKSM